ncbi:MAG: metal-dependent hydrolase [Bacillaceae bacterium]
MDTISHGLIGLAMYGAVNKTNLTKKEKTAFVLTAVIANQIPDIDVIASVTETGAIMQQMWHRGLTHSLFLVPIWTLFIYVIIRAIFKIKDKRLFFLALIGVLTHDILDGFNTWGTGLFEPFSKARITLGTISIVDFVFWAIFIGAFFIARKRPNNHRIYRQGFMLMAGYIFLQSAVGLYYLDNVGKSAEQATLSASFIPFDYKVISKKEDIVTVTQASLWRKEKVVQTIVNDSTIDLDALNKVNPKINVLRQWSPFVVAFQDNDKMGIYDPRFFVNGESFLTETVKKN